MTKDDMEKLRINVVWTGNRTIYMLRFVPFCTWCDQKSNLHCRTRKIKYEKEI